jgi:2-oxoglutarate ferredoxin oxidoreductase subunit beta
VSELLSVLEGTAYIARGTVHNAANVRKTKSYIKKAFEYQMNGIGFTMVEILSPCPTGWGLEADVSPAWLEKNMIPIFPLGEIKKPASEAKPIAAELEEKCRAGAA